MSAQDWQMTLLNLEGMTSYCLASNAPRIKLCHFQARSSGKIKRLLYIFVLFEKRD